MAQDVSTSHGDLAAEVSDAGNLAAEPFVGRWNRLVSRTNWEKGRIICDWRDALIADGASNAAFSDETWAERVGGVSGQHVGRLRRVSQRFADVYEEYEGLSWSHFFAALDWTDAEMWLEGAVQNKWSVSQTRGKRWETLGSPEDLKPDDGDIVASESVEESVDEDAADDEEMQGVANQTTSVQPVDVDVDESSEAETWDDEGTDAGGVASDSKPTVPSVRPFADLPKLPDDLTDAFEQFKVAILSHKMSGWDEVACEDVLAILDALKSLALAPSGDGA